MAREIIRTLITESLYDYIVTCRVILSRTEVCNFLSSSFFLVIFEIFVEDLNLFGQRSNLLIAYSKLSLGNFQQLLPCFSLTFSRTLSRCCCLATRLTNSFYFLESFRIAINRSIERTKFALPRNLSSFGERAGARSCISRVSFSLRFDKPPRFQVTDLLSIARCMGLRGT